MSASQVITRVPEHSSPESLHYQTNVPTMDLTLQKLPRAQYLVNANIVRAHKEPKGISAGSNECFPSSEKLSRSDFNLLTTLGTGTFARVWLVRPTKDFKSRGVSASQLYALKVLRKADVVRLKQCAHTKSEREILYCCRKHPFISQLVDTWSDWNSVYLLLDYCPGGELFSYLRRLIRFPIATTRFYSAEITSVLVFLHRNGVVYRDLKPENVMIDARGHIRMVDFGFSKQIGDFKTYTLCGTPEYIAPEVLLTKGHGNAVDWWALGIFIFELSCGYPPFYGNSANKTYKKIIEAEVEFPSNIVLPEDCKDIIQQLCTKDSSARLGNLRGGSEDVKNHPFFSDIDWDELEKKSELGPIIPQLENSEDTKNFDNYPPPDSQSPDDYTISMYDTWENYFRDF